MPFGWGIVGTGKHPDIKVAPAMAAADGGELVGVYSRDQHRAEAFAEAPLTRPVHRPLDSPRKLGLASLAVLALLELELEFSLNDGSPGDDRVEELEVRHFVVLRYRHTRR